MEANSLAEALKLIMEINGWTQAQLARELGRSQPWVTLVMQGKRDPGLQDTNERLARVGWESVLRPIEEEKEIPVKRREFGEKVVKTAAAAAVPVPFVPTGNGNPYRDHEYIRSLAKNVESSRQAHGGARLIEVTGRHLEKIRTIAGDRNGRKWRLAASELTKLHALNLYDAHRLDPAEQVARDALNLAARTQDPDAQAGIYGTLSQINTYMGRGDLGKMYAERGLEINDMSDRKRVNLQIRLGRSLAIIEGQERSARGALEPAFAIVDIPPTAIAQGLGNIGIGLNSLGNHQNAMASLEKAVELTQGWATYYQAEFIAQYAIAALHTDDMETAIREMSAFAHLVPLISSRRIDRIGRDLLAESAKWARILEVQAARDQLQVVLPREYRKPTTR